MATLVVLKDPSQKIATYCSDNKLNVVVISDRLPDADILINASKNGNYIQNIVLSDYIWILDNPLKFKYSIQTAYQYNQNIVYYLARERVRIHIEEMIEDKDFMNNMAIDEDIVNSLERILGNMMIKN